MLLFIIFPIAGFACFFLFLGNRFSYENSRLLILRAAGLAAGYVVISLEVLSLFHAITRLGLVITWSILLVVFAAWAVQRRRRGAPLNLPALRLPKDWAGWSMLVILSVVVGVTALVAWLTPPQTWDSLTYHMSRVAHWAQNRSLDHYRTGIPRQISMSPGAEMITLDGYVLTGSDRLAAFTQWSAMLGSLIGVSLIAKLLGAKPTGQWAAAVFTATFPIGISEASSTITDYTAAFWLVCVAVESLEFFRTRKKIALFHLGLAAGLSILTKPIVVPYLVPFAILDVVLIFKRLGMRGGLQWGAAAILTVGLINAGYLSRNIRTFGALSNPTDFRIQSNELITPQGIISNVIKNAALHAGLPDIPGTKFIRRYDSWLARMIKNVHVRLGVDMYDPRTTGDGVLRVASPSTQEDLASNPLHAYLILLSFLLVFPLWKKVGGLAVLYAVFIALAFILYCAIFKWHIFTVRYHVPFFVLFAPVIGVLLGSLNGRIWGVAVSAGLLIAAFPWLFQIDSRPLIPLAGHSTTGSILTTPRDVLYFANTVGNYDVFNRIVGDINANHCSQVGLMLRGDDPEYLFWALLGAPREDLRIEWIVSGAISNRLPELDFKPCAIVCKKCTDASIGNLHLAYEVNDLQLYLSTVK